MNTNRNRSYLIVVAYIIFSMACSIFGGGDDANNGSTLKVDSKYLGEEFRSAGGGFSIQKVKDYNFKEVLGIVNMIAPGADTEIGPGIMVMGGLMEEEMTNDDLLEKMRKDSDAIKILKEKSIEIAGEKGYSAEIEGTYDGKLVKGRVVVVMVTPKQQFNMMGFAPEDDWKELSPIFEAVLTSVKFFEPDPEAASAEEESDTDKDMAVPQESEATSSNGASEEKQSKPGEIRQWANSARASSQYGNPNWSASQALGEPDVTECGDNTNAWASEDDNTVEWIELTYPTPVVPTEINIYQSYNPSQVVEVMMYATNGERFIAWEGYPESVENCPDLMTITLELDKKIMVNKLRITIDQQVNGWGWNEIDAVELVGTSDESSSNPKKPSTVGSSGTSIDSGKPAPTNFSGWMAGKNYQGYARTEINKTMQKDLDKLIGLQGKKSTENYKPRPDHKDTYIYEFPEGMKVYVGVLTNGVVYKKSITPGAYPKDYKLNTVTKENYKKLDAIYKKDQKIPYSVMANLLKSPGFIRESYYADGKIKTQYEWYASNGDRIGGFFIEDMLTGMAGLVYIPKE
jgi:hypothetical protein